MRYLNAILTINVSKNMVSFGYGQISPDSSDQLINNIFKYVVSFC